MYSVLYCLCYSCLLYLDNCENIFYQNEVLNQVWDSSVGDDEEASDGSGNSWGVAIVLDSISSDFGSFADGTGHATVRVSASAARWVSGAGISGLLSCATTRDQLQLNMWISYCKSLYTEYTLYWEKISQRITYITTGVYNDFSNRKIE